MFPDISDGVRPLKVGNRGRRPPDLWDRLAKPICLLWPHDGSIGALSEAAGRGTGAPRPARWQGVGATSTHGEGARPMAVPARPGLQSNARWYPVRMPGAALNSSCRCGRHASAPRTSGHEPSAARDERRVAERIASQARAHTRHFTPPADFAMRRVRSKFRAGQGKRAVLSDHIEDGMGAHGLSAVIRALSNGIFCCLIVDPRWGARRWRTTKCLKDQSGAISINKWTLQDLDRVNKVHSAVERERMDC